MPTKTAIRQARADTMPIAYWGRNRIWEEDENKSGLERISWKEILTQSKPPKKFAQFMKSLGLIDQINPINKPRLFGNVKPRMDLQKGNRR